MLDFDVQRCTRRCAATDRELKAGETCYSVLVQQGSNVVRRDYAAEAWPGPPEQSLGWWKAVVPEGAAQRVAWAPNDLMLDYFDRLEERPDKADVRYVLALLLVRRRLLRHDESATARTDDDQLVLFCPRNEREYRVPAVLPDDERVKEIQQELSSLLFGDGQAMLDALAPPPSATDPPELGLFTGEVSEDPSAEDLLTGLLASSEESDAESPVESPS